MIELIKAPALSDKDIQALCDYRLARIRAEMSRQGVSLCVLNNPVSLRYAINFDEYQLFQSHIPTCYLFVPLEGPLVMHGATGREWPNVQEYRRPDFLTPFDGGLDPERNSGRFAKAVLDFMAEHRLGEGGQAVALERFGPGVNQALRVQNLQLVDAECLLERARLIKADIEIACMRHAVAVAEYGMQLMRQSMRPGITENQLWSVLHQVNVAHGGNWIEGRMLSSGPRTNPWLQESSHRVIDAGDMVAFDTDMIGPMGYIADISRSWICGGGAGTEQQRAAYRHAYDEIHHNMALIRPGIRFSELRDRAWQRAPQYQANRYVCSFHGAGLCDEYPKIYYAEDWAHSGYDGVVEENMVLCVESYSGALGGDVGVKLEEMVRVTASGYERLTTYPFEQELLM
ncbi:M24 family metallopeptidase [Marinobacterium rhizophilum]|uniref:Aminopeptidase P family protein n=1 Tax=Marinobacterium rhizophilum TaxID=420402 RepID=A0ABY5HL82_9GAMM|nr:Xaa-Pro peptidase family protein [Marinobacterium rhizophilum]UTW13058.1 aminopeptidase P family protein [Marinobacterium rhizophilum]